MGIIHAASSPTTNINTTSPVFLLLVDDNRGGSSTAVSNNNNNNQVGAYAAHLVTIKQNAFHKLNAAPSTFDYNYGGGTNKNKNNMKNKSSIPPHHHHHHKRGGSDRSGSGNMNSWFGGGERDNAVGAAAASASGPKSNISSSTTIANDKNNRDTQQQSSSLAALPRMSCVTYHPNTGYIYACGTGVYGLSHQAVKAVLAAGISSSSSTADIILTPPPTAVYLKCNHALPLPGVRGGGGSSSSSRSQSMALTCSGRVTIVAVTNAFYAVPCFLDVNVIKSIVCRSSSSGGVDDDPSARAAVTASSLPNVTATKIISFAQSSQVHPVIAMEVMTSASQSQPPTVTTTNSSSSRPSDVLKSYLRPITSLVLLASGRECTTLQLMSIPDAQSVSMINKGGSVVGGMIATSITSSLEVGGGGATTNHNHNKPQMATLPSPILAAAPLPSTRESNNNCCGGGGGDLSAGPLVALLTVDGLVHIRSPFCVAVPLTSIEVGTRPNDYAMLSSLSLLLPNNNNNNNTKNNSSRNIVATSYGGEARIITTNVESSQDFADRLMKLCIDAFGSHGFPRLELAEALGATFSATSYVGGGGPVGGESTTVHKRIILLKQYLESVLGLMDDISLRFLSSSSSSSVKRNNVSVVTSEDGQESGLEVVTEEHEMNDQEGGGGDDEKTIIKDSTTASRTLGENALLTCTALFCLVCYQLNPPNGIAACRASKVCASAMGIVRPNSVISKAAMAVCELVADRLLLNDASTTITAAPNSSSSTTRPLTMEFVESAVWMLRSCGCHEKAIHVLQDRMNSPAFRNTLVGSSGSGTGGGWSQIKFDSYIATHLGELWSSKDDQCCQLVLLSSATRDLIARNPTLGLSVFTTLHPQNEGEWKAMKPSDDPLAHPVYPSKVVDLLKSINPQQSSGGANHELVTIENFSPRSGKESFRLPNDSGRSLAVSYLESAIGISTGRSSSQEANVSNLYQPESRAEVDERKADMHDELSYLLLEGVISERGDEDRGEDSPLGSLYRFKLRRLLSWPNSKIRSERLLGSLPSSFLREHALLLGRLGRHEDALKILYSQSLELALEYCDVRHERQQTQVEEANSRGDSDQIKLNECAYIPLVRVALSLDPDSTEGIAAAIKVLALRRNSIDKAAALRLLPRNMPMSSIARPFLIPAVVEDESQVRRLTIASALLRSRYTQLKKKLTEAQLKAQSSIHNSPALQKLNLGDLLHSCKPFKARPVHTASPFSPDVMLTKHFFPRHLVIQAQVLNSRGSTATAPSQNDTRTLSNVAFVVAESSDEALVTKMELPLKTIPPGAVGSVWCVLAASPQRLDGAAFLTCELRFTVLEVDATTGVPVNFSDGANAATTDGFGRTFVEELQDIDVRHSEFV